MSTITTVLLVEGDIIVRHPLAEYLRGCGFKVVETSNGNEARTLLKTPDVEIDLVLVDMMTPAGGFELSRWIKTEGLVVEVVLAGSVEKAVQHAGKICNEGPALAKPYDHVLVLEHIRRILARRERGRS
jgi:DNA-binding response OmpR family regulator